MWSWGGTDHWWHEVEQDSWWQTHWRGDTTPRSTALLLTGGKVHARGRGTQTDRVSLHNEDVTATYALLFVGRQGALEMAWHTSGSGLLTTRT